MSRTREDLDREIEALQKREILVATNEGTYSGGDPAYKTYRIYEEVGGGERHEGCDIDRAPGNIRRFRSELHAARTKLYELIRERNSIAK